MDSRSLPSQNLGPKDQIDDVKELLIQLTGNSVNYGNAAYKKELYEDVSRIISDHCKDDEKPKDEALKQNYDYLQPLTKASYPKAKYAPYYRVSKVNNPSDALLSSTESGEEVKVETTLRERLAQADLLVMGNNITKPLRSIREAALHADIHQVLYSNGFHTITNLQKHMWPAILRGQDVVSVGGPLTGKTLGYLVPIASNMLDNSLYKGLEFSMGPLSVILCAETSKALYLNTMLEKFASNGQENNQGQNLKIKIILMYEGCAEVEQLQQMMNGCHVLITTPAFFLRILRFFNHSTDLQRLCHLIFDSADILFQRQKELVDRILAECTKILNVERRKKRPMQIIVTCQRWNKYVEDFTRFVSVNPTVLISCGLEVLAFCKLEPKIHKISTRTSRASRVIDLVKEYHGTERIVVVFNTEAEAMNIGILLEGKVKNLLMAYDSMDQLSIASVNERWLHTAGNANRQPVLLVTDCVLQELEVRNAQILIHYSMPIMKDVFNERIGCILQTCLDPPIEMLIAERPEVHFLLDCNDGRQTPALVDLLIRQRLEVPAGLMIKAKEAIKAREEMKNDSTLCTNLRNFGYCFQESSCPFPHVVRSALDKNPPSVPESGEVDMKVIKIHSATHFSARLEKHKSVDGVTTDLMTKEHILVPMKMKKNYSDQSNSNEKEETSEEKRNSPGHMYKKKTMKYCEPTEGKKPVKPPGQREKKSLLKYPTTNSGSQELKRKTVNASSESKENSGFVKSEHEAENIKVVGKYPMQPKELWLADESLAFESDIDNTYKKPRSSGQLPKSANTQLKESGIKQNLVLHQICGDLFNAPRGASLAHTVAEDFIMTKGIAKSFNEKFGCREELLNQRKKVGEVAYLQKGGICIFYLVTKKYTSRNCTPTMCSLKQSLMELKRMCMELNIHYLAMPRIGTGINQLDWTAVKELIETIFSEVDMTISIYQCVVQELPGNIFSAPYAVSLAHCVAEDFKMTQGISRSFRYKFGKLEELQAQQKKVGQVAFLQERVRFVFYLVTKEESTFNCKPTLQSMESCLIALRQLCKQFHVTRLAMPKIGSGIDHLTWADVKHLIEFIFKDSNINISVYYEEYC